MRSRRIRGWRLPLRSSRRGRWIDCVVSNLFTLRFDVLHLTPDTRLLSAVLAEIESCQARNRPYPEMLKHMTEHLKKHLPLSANTAQVNHYNEREKDHISHYVLRLAFCRSEELRRRFVKAETLLFKLRLDSDDARERDAFLETLQLDWKPVPEEDKERLKGKLLSATPWIRKNWASERFYGVPWTKVLDLVERRRVYMEAGLAFVPAAEQSSLVLAEFSSRLEKQMEVSIFACERV